MERHGVYFCGSEQGKVAGACECGNKMRGIS